MANIVCQYTQKLLRKNSSPTISSNRLSSRSSSGVKNSFISSPCALDDNSILPSVSCAWPRFSVVRRSE